MGVTCCFRPGNDDHAPDSARIPLNHGAHVLRMRARLRNHLGWADDAWTCVQEEDNTKKRSERKKRAFSCRSGARRATLAHPNRPKLKVRSPYMAPVLGDHLGQAGDGRSAREGRERAGKKNVTLSRSGPPRAQRSAERFENQESGFLHHSTYACQFSRRSVAWCCTEITKGAFLAKKRYITARWHHRDGIPSTFHSLRSFHVFRGWSAWQAPPCLAVPP